jgi:hypothetical protein
MQRFRRCLRPLSAIIQEGPRRFFVLAFALAAPFWLLGTVVDASILPRLPIAALDFLCPGAAALILVYRADGKAAAVALVQRSFDFKRVTVKAWYLPTLLLMPLIMAVSFGVIRLTGVPLPISHIVSVRALLLCIVFFGGALGEELGWTGYATDRLQRRWSALQASLIIGSAWASYHFVALLQAGRSITWIAWWTLSTVAARVIIVWLYNNTNMSVFIATLFHMTINVTWQVFPVNGSYYDPRITGLVTALVAVVVVLFWGPRGLTRRIPPQEEFGHRPYRSSVNPARPGSFFWYRWPLLFTQGHERAGRPVRRGLA